MKRRLRVLERAFLLVGLVLLLLCLITGSGWLHPRVQAASFRESQEPLALAAQGQPRIQQHTPDFTLWSLARIRAYRETASQELPQSLALLRIPSVNLEAQVLRGTGELNLNAGVGLIPGTAAPGTRGNVGLAGHRDGFFRRLKGLHIGDTIELVTRSGTDVYVIHKLQVTSRRDISVLTSQSKPSVTLVTCYPFYRIGKASQRFVVQAILREPGTTKP